MSPTRTNAGAARAATNTPDNPTPPGRAKDSGVGVPTGAEHPGDAQGAGEAIPREGVYARDLVKRFDDEDVIKSLDLHVEPGMIVGLIGPSGCGKTTTV